MLVNIQIMTLFGSTYLVVVATGIKNPIKRLVVANSRIAVTGPQIGYPTAQSQTAVLNKVVDLRTLRVSPPMFRSAVGDRWVIRI